MRDSSRHLSARCGWPNPAVQPTRYTAGGRLT